MTANRLATTAQSKYLGHLATGPAAVAAGLIVAFIMYHLGWIGS